MATPVESALKLFACPHACSLVSHIALEMASAEFSFEFLNLFEAKHQDEKFLQLNPKGKVPVLVSGDTVVTENVAILVWIAEKFPEAQLLPRQGTGAFIDALSDLCWFSSTIHPLITRLAVPARFVDDPECAPTVREAARAGLMMEFGRINQRLEGRLWWSQHPSAHDAYLLWLWARVNECEFDASSFVNFAGVVKRLLTLPPVQRVIQREQAIMPCFQQLKTENL